MQLCDTIFPITRRRFLAKLPAPIGFICDDFASQHIEDLIEIRPGIDRNIQRKNFWPIVRTRVGQHFVEVSVLFIDSVDDEYPRNSAVLRAMPHSLCAYANAVL